MEKVMLNTPKNTLAAIPGLLGFYPENSVVILFMEDNALMLTTRANDTEMLSSNDTFSGYINNLCELHGFTSVITAYYGEMVDEYSEAVRHFAELCETSDGPALIDSLIVRPDGSFTAVDGEEDGSGVLTAQDYESSPVVAAVVLGGGQVSRTRQEIVNEVKTAKRTNKLHKEASVLAAELRASKPELVDYRWAAYRFGTAVVDDPEPVVTDVLALGLMLNDVKVRDAMVHHIVTQEDRRAIRARLMSALPHMPERDAAPLLGLIGVASYSYGDGLRAIVAAEKCLEIDADYGLAALLVKTVEASVPPRDWIDIVTSMTLEEVIS